MVSEVLWIRVSNLVQACSHCWSMRVAFCRRVVRSTIWWELAPKNLLLNAAMFSIGRRLRSRPGGGGGWWWLSRQENIGRDT
jgi:hypothetical protein